MSNRIQPSDLGFLVTLASSGSLSAAARESGVSKAAVSKKLVQALPAWETPEADIQAV